MNDINYVKFLLITLVSGALFLLIWGVFCDKQRTDRNNGFIGLASWYNEGFQTANGEKFDPAKFTCATYKYNFNTTLKVTDLNNNKSIIVRVNDTGPNTDMEHRIIDLTPAAFSALEDLKVGLIRVKIEAADKYAKE